MRISIPARKLAPSTSLYVNIVTQHKATLGSRPVVFMLPGGPGLDSSFYQAYSCLTDVADVVYHDPRGCGLSDKGEPATYTMDNYIDDVEQIRIHLNVNSAIILGKSYGSVCALGYALRYPGAIDKLILAAGAPSYRFLETARKNLAKRGTPEQIEICEKLWRGEFKNKAELGDFFKIMGTLYSNKAKSGTELFKDDQNEPSFSVEAINVGFSTFLKDFDYEQELKNIRCKTLILAGEDDWINDVQYAKQMADKIPHNHLKIFSNSSHSMELDVTEQYFQEIRRFIVEKNS